MNVHGGGDLMLIFEGQTCNAVIRVGGRQWDYPTNTPIASTVNGSLKYKLTKDNFEMVYGTEIANLNM